MINVLFVCLGNICRSPMAEGLFIKTVADRGLRGEIHIESRALGRWEQGNPVHRGTKIYLEKHGIDSSYMRSELIKASDFEQFDFIIGMDQQNVKELKKLAGKKYKEKIYLFLDVNPALSGESVPDPYYDGNFELTYSLITHSIDLWMERFVNALNLQK